MDQPRQRNPSFLPLREIAAGEIGARAESELFERGRRLVRG